MTGRAVGVRARPAVVALDRVDVSCCHHRLPERPRVVPRVHPDVVMREGLPDVPNHFSPDSLTSHLRIEYPNIVDLDVVSVGYHPADSVRNELREVEPARLVTDWEEPLAVRHCGRLALVCLLSLMYLWLHSHISFVYL